MEKPKIEISRVEVRLKPPPIHVFHVVLENDSDISERFISAIALDETQI